MEDWRGMILCWGDEEDWRWMISCWGDEEDWRGMISISGLKQKEWGEWGGETTININRFEGGGKGCFCNWIGCLPVTYPGFLRGEMLRSQTRDQAAGLKIATTIRSNPSSPLSNSNSHICGCLIPTLPPLHSPFPPWSTSVLVDPCCHRWFRTVPHTGHVKQSINVSFSFC